MRAGTGVIGLLLLAVLTGGRTLCAQEVPSLDRVETLMGQGRIIQARQVLEGWWNSVGPDASRVEWQRSIWLRGRLTVDPSMAEFDYRRLVLEYPGGPYSDDALYRLAQWAESRGDLREAQARFEMLMRDYPSSRHLPEGRSWLRRHAEELDALPEVVTRREPEAPEEETEVDTGGFSVQVGAFRSLNRARAVAAELGELGFQVRLVRTPGTELARVRVGRFPSRDEAEAMGRRLEDSGFDHTIVTDVGSEERIGSGNAG